LFNNNNITVITASKFFYLLEDPNVELVDCNELEDYSFNNNSNLDKQFRNGFWHLCSLRFFYIYSYIKSNNLCNCIHLENDVLTYIDFKNFDKYIKQNKVYATYDCDNRVIPGLMFIPNYQAFEPIIKNYNFNLNDMQNLALFDENTILPLPIFTNNYNNHKITKLYNKFNCIFDAAAIGQYLGGVDPRNQNGDTRGFINETCIIKYNDYKFYWIINDKGLYQPHLLCNGNYIQIINLHIHAKSLNRFMADNPKETKFIQIQ